MQYGLSDRAMNTITAILAKYPGIRSVILYGSRARGNYKTGSDIDITLHTDNSFFHADLLRLMTDFDDSDLPYLVDISLFDAINNEDLKDHIRRIGKVLYEKDAALAHA